MDRISTDWKRCRTEQYGEDLGCMNATERVPKKSVDKETLFTRLSIRTLFNSRLRTNMLSGIVVTIANTLTLLLAYPIYIHFLGIEIYGLWLIANTVPQLARFSDLGVMHAVTKVVAEEYGRKELRAIQQYIFAAVVLLLITGSVVMLGTICFRDVIIHAFRLNETQCEMMQWLLPLMGALSVYVILVQTINSSLSGIGRSDLANYTHAVSRMAAVVVAVVGFLVHRGIESLFIAELFGWAVLHMLSTTCFRRITGVPMIVFQRPAPNRIYRLLRFGSGVIGSAIIRIFLFPFHKWLLCVFGGAGSVVIYELALNGAKQVRSLAEGALRAIMPEVSFLEAKLGSSARLQLTRINRRAVVIAVALTLPNCIIILVAAEPLVGLWVGGEIARNVAPALMVMSIAWLFSTVCIPSYYTLLGLGKVSVIFVDSCLMVATSFVVVLLVLQSTGTITPVGLAWSMVVAMFVHSVFILYRNRSCLSLRLAGNYE